MYITLGIFGFATGWLAYKLIQYPVINYKPETFTITKVDTNKVQPLQTYSILKPQTLPQKETLCLPYTESH